MNGSFQKFLQYKMSGGLGLRTYRVSHRQRHISKVVWPKWNMMGNACKCVHTNYCHTLCIFYICIFLFHSTRFIFLILLFPPYLYNSFLLLLSPVYLFSPPIFSAHMWPLIFYPFIFNSHMEHTLIFLFLTFSFSFLFFFILLSTISLQRIFLGRYPSHSILASLSLIPVFVYCFLFFHFQFQTTTNFMFLKFLKATIHQRHVSYW